MAKRRCTYTRIGKRIAALAKNQVELGRIVGVSKQAISLKLRGKAAILVADLEKLVHHYGVPMAYFFKEPQASPELEASWARILCMSTVSHELVCLASTLPAPETRKLLDIAKVLIADTGRLPRESQPNISS